jgi:hypothetical protein
MLLVTFHGGSSGITNVYAYNTSSNQVNTETALINITLKDSELRGLVYANSYLYVVNGEKSVSNILCFQPPAPGSTLYQFNYICDFLDASFSKKDHFENSIGHPYALAFDGQGFCYVSNQDTNVAAQATVAANFQTASIQKGCQSQYLNGQTSFCPKGGCVYLDGTFVASQNGTLPDVETPATDVPSQFGGLAVSFSSSGSSLKVQNSVRDVAVMGGVLFVCDEPSNLIRLYSVKDGTYLGSGPTLPASPTHLAVQPSGGGLYVSAGQQIYWSALASSPTPSSLCFTAVLPSLPDSKYKVGGITFNPGGSPMYVAFQDGTGTTGKGAIYSYTIMRTDPPQTPPALLDGALFASIGSDTPEFVLFVPDP